jgi:uncharacterized membrane protein (UPF0136 family)
MLTLIIGYGLTGTVKSSETERATNIALANSLLVLLGCVVHYVRRNTFFSLVMSLFFSALYFLGFVRLQAGQAYGYELAFLTSVMLGLVSLLQGFEVVHNLLPKEIYLLSVHGLVTFALGIHFWLAAGPTIVFLVMVLGYFGPRIIKESQSAERLGLDL